MKILKIAFQNINSLKGYHEIDFSNAPFTTSSLFAITGPTGSGKSTVLDVISLGLFAQVPRLGKITKNDVLSKGAILTRNQKEAFARVTYLCKRGTFESIWRISTNSRGNLRDYEMQLINVETHQALDLKKSEVPGKNEDLIGLNYNQFIKSVLLAQGEFAQLLKARKDERGALLEKITGTGVYRRLGQLSFEKYREVTAAIEKQQHELEIILQNVLQQEEALNYKKELEEKDTLYTQTESKLELIKQQLSLKKDVIQRKKAIQSLEDSLAQVETEVTAFENAHGQPLKAHEQVRHGAEELRSWTLLHSNLEELQKNIQQKKEAENQSRQAVVRCLESTSKLTGMQSSAETISQNLRSFADKVSKLQRLQETKRADYSHLRQQLLAILEGIPFKLQSDAPYEGVKQIQQLITHSQDQLQSLKAQLGSLNLDKLAQEKQHLQQLLTKGRQAIEKNQELNHLQKDLATLEKSLAQLKERMEQFPATIKGLNDRVLIEEKDLDILVLKKDKEVLHAKVEDLRQRLNHGEPCPLCGSLEHPYGEHAPEKEDGLEKAIQLKRKHIRGLQHELSSSSATFKSYGEQFEMLQKNHQTKKNELQQRESSFKDQFELLQNQEEILDWKAWCQQKESQLHALENFDTESQRLFKLQKSLPLYRELIELVEQGKIIKKELSGLYKGKDVHQDCNKLNDDWIGHSNTLRSLLDLQQELQESILSKQKEISSVEGTLTKLLAQTSFADIPSARRALLPDPKVHRLQTQRDAISDKKKKLENSRNLLVQQLAEIQQNEIETPQEKLESQYGQYQESLLSLRQRCESLRRILKNEEERQEQARRLRNKMAESEKTTRRWRLLKELIGDATGKKFNDFAQDISLSQLLQLANHRLADLSDRYQLDKPNQDEDDGLIALDEHMGGQRRSVKTLSGGETFLLSLAMALALSDLASRNVEIDSLFIDEGFGTLDPETLDQTLDTLEKLQAESSKTIGIISHVESLKERIATQVRLERNGQGYSQLSITP